MCLDTEHISEKKEFKNLTRSQFLIIMNSGLGELVTFYLIEVKSPKNLWGENFRSFLKEVKSPTESMGRICDLISERSKIPTEYMGRICELIS